jgi:hypothetical protein
MSRINPVAKYAKEFNRCKVYKVKKKASKTRKQKHKGKVDD